MLVKVGPCGVCPPEYRALLVLNNRAILYASAHVEKSWLNDDVPDTFCVEERSGKETSGEVESFTVGVRPSGRLVYYLVQKVT